MSGRTTPAPVADPRSIVTPDAFQVSTELLGTPLAAPWRRMAALLIDLALIGVLQLLGWGVLGGVAAVIGLRLAMRRSGGAPMGPVARGALGCASVFVFMVAVGVTVFTTGQVRQALMGRGDAEVPADVAASGSGLRLGELIDGFGNFVALAEAETEAEAIEAAVQVGRAMRATGVRPEDLRAALTELVEENTDFDADDVVGPAVAEILGEEAPADVDDAAVVETPLPPLPDEAADSIRALESTVESLAAALEASQEDLREAQASQPGDDDSPSTVFTWIRDAADEAGLIFGWGTVYLTLFLVLWDGRTPGKRALDLRVVRLNGEPLTLFLSLERAGGYAAGLATGLLGFAQVWWDPNRQAIHDKIAETVVIRDKLPRPAWAVGERLQETAGAGRGTPPRKDVPSS